MRFAGTLYRALNPYWAYRPLSGDGAARLGGRFNKVGRPALYLAFSVETALNEVNQAGSFMPTTLIAVAADLEPVLDATDAAALAGFDLGPEALADPHWAMRMAQGRSVPTQTLAERAISEGYCGMIVPSFAPGARAEARNMVLWRWGADLPTRVALIDEQGRLSHPPAPPENA